MRYSLVILAMLMLYRVGTAETAKHTDMADLNHQTGISVIDQSGIEMVYVPAGSFEMGEDEITIRELYQLSEHDYDLAFGSFEILDPYSVNLYGFWIDKYEVTVEAYENTNCVRNGYCKSLTDIVPEMFFDDPQKPAVGVDWYDAMQFCNLRNARLPTEEEWEYAASGPNNFLFPWGNNPNQENITESMAGGTYPVGAKKGNVSWVGAYDMAGNVREWVEDRYFPAYSFEFTPDNPPLSGDEFTRAVRGGSYYENLVSVTTFERRGEPAYGRTVDVGFRCARTSDPRDD